MFGRIAQRLIKKTVDALIANNPPGFIPDEITRLLEKVFTFNVCFTDNTISSGNVSFQVNTIVAEIDDGNPVPLTPVGSQSSSAVLSHHAGTSVECTPVKDSDFTLPSPSARTQATHASSTTPSKTVMPDTGLPTTPRSSTRSDKNKVE
jgi:replication factor A1